MRKPATSTSTASWCGSSAKPSRGRGCAAPPDRGAGAKTGPRSALRDTYVPASGPAPCRKALCRRCKCFLCRAVGTPSERQKPNRGLLGHLCRPDNGRFGNANRHLQGGNSAGASAKRRLPSMEVSICGPVGTLASMQGSFAGGCGERVAWLSRGVWQRVNLAASWAGGAKAGWQGANRLGTHVAGRCQLSVPLERHARRIAPTRPR